MNAAKASTEFTSVIEMLTEALRMLGQAIAAPIVQSVEGSQGGMGAFLREMGKASKLARTTGSPYGPITPGQQALFQAQRIARPRLLEGPEYTSPASDQFKEDKKQTGYLARIAVSQEASLRAMLRADAVDPW